MYLERHVSERLLYLAKHFPVVVVMGARQVGKTTLLRHLLGEKFPMVVFDPTVDVENARQDPDLFLKSHPGPLMLDEIQFAPQVVSALKRAIDMERRPGRYFLTGSQQWSIMKSLSESLAGRAVFLELGSFSLGEIAGIPKRNGWLAHWLEKPGDLSHFATMALPVPIHEQLWRGFLPEAQRLPLEAVPAFCDAYVRTYVERDARSLAEFADLPTFGRFYRLMAALTGQEINHSQLGREIGVTPQTAKRWLGVLQGTFQWFELPSYAGNLIKRVSGKPKGYFSDTGLAAWAQAITSPQAIANHPLRGALFESAVVGDIIKQVQALATPVRLYHWRSHGGAEVDIVLEKDGALFPIEIKMKTHPARSDASGLRAFRAAHLKQDIKTGLVLGAGDHSFRLTEDVCVLPWTAHKSIS